MEVEVEDVVEDVVEVDDEVEADHKMDFKDFNLSKIKLLNLMINNQNKNIVHTI